MSAASSSSPSSLSPEEAVRRVARAREVLVGEVHKVVVGQDELIEQLLIVLFAGEHCLAVGMPGLAKTLTISTLAHALHQRFSRFSLTPDVTPQDIFGTESVEEMRQGTHPTAKFVRGPIFANFVVADGLNRASPKTKAALLKAMHERQIVACGNTYDLESPWLVVATQNPVEHQANGSLPEDQRDWFMLSIKVGYPTRDEECAIVSAVANDPLTEVRPVLRTRDILWIQRLVSQFPASKAVIEYAVDIVRATRPDDLDSPDFVKRWLAWGAGPRATQHLIAGAKARALMKGRFAVHAADVRAMTKPVLRHRLCLNAVARNERVDIDQVIEQLMRTVRGPAEAEHNAPPVVVLVGPGNPAAAASTSRDGVEPTTSPELPPPIASSVESKSRGTRSSDRPSEPRRNETDT